MQLYLLYIGSVILKNSSLYDPFWSVAPVPIAIYLATQYQNSATTKSSSISTNNILGFKTNKKLDYKLERF